MTFLKSQKYGNSKKIVVARALGRGCWVGKARGNFYGGKSILYNNVIVDTRHYAFVKTHTTLQHKTGP